MKIWLRILYDERVLSFFQDLEEFNRLSSQVDLGIEEEKIPVPVPQIRPGNYRQVDRSIMRRIP